MEQGTEKPADRREQQDNWGRIDFVSFATSMAMRGNEADRAAAERAGVDVSVFHGRNDFMLIVKYLASDVNDAPLVKFIAKWTSCDGTRCHAASLSYELCLWRAAQTERANMARLRTAQNGCQPDANVEAITSADNLAHLAQEPVSILVEDLVGDDLKSDKLSDGYQ
jgi:hypothetical protein